MLNSPRVVGAVVCIGPLELGDASLKTTVREGKISAEIWPDDLVKARQKEIDARWAIQFGKARVPEDGGPAPPDIAIPSFGYRRIIPSTSGISAESRIELNVFLCDR